VTITPKASTPGSRGTLRARRAPGLLTRAAVTNLGAQGAALAAVSLASLMVARVGGPTVVGEYALIRVLPWLFAVILSAGLPTASAFFLAGKHTTDRSLRPTLALMTVAGATLGTAAWLVCAEPFHVLFFRLLPLRLVAILGVLVITQLVTITAKGCCQGSGDITGASLVIVAEELWFVVVYPPLHFLEIGHGITTVILALMISGALAALTGLARLARRQFFADWGRPSVRLTGRIAAFGARGQLGNMLWLMNLRFDFILLGALAGPAVLGIYAVASKFAELMRLVPTAINYVLYPRFARVEPEKATAEARKLLPRATALTLVLTPFVAVFCYVALPILYGRAFAGAVLPAEIIIVGLSIEGAAAVASAYLLGTGRPGLNSAGMGVGAAITLTLDVMLIPRYGVMGGAVTSAITYLASTTTLVYLASRSATASDRRAMRRPGHGTGDGEPQEVLRSDTALRRMMDVVIGCIALAAVSPLLLAVGLAVRLSSPGPVLYRQVRVGKSGQLFTILKFRSMICDADRSGPLVTDHADPRVTRVGALIRSSKLDELPQFLNVVRGDMTLIGPRPEVPRFLSCYRAEELRILSVRPGLTGAGQILFTELRAGEDIILDPEAHYISVQLHPKLAIDLDYLRRRSAGSDLAILLRTFALVCHLARPAPMTAITQDAARP
jgi:lipopolysaccharide/colanic/teichoic acid biosynthesis glycosyltransferase/O-antigen/teichoic acid export membrane protein